MRRLALPTCVAVGAALASMRTAPPEGSANLSEMASTGCGAWTQERRQYGPQATIDGEWVLGFVSGGKLEPGVKPRFPRLHANADSRTVESEYNEALASAALLDHYLAAYGKDTQEARELLCHFLVRRFQARWPEDDFGSREPAVALNRSELVEMEQRILRLAPRDDAQKWFQSQALQLANGAVGAKESGAGSTYPHASTRKAETQAGIEEDLIGSEPAPTCRCDRRSATIGGFGRRQQAADTYLLQWPMALSLMA